MVPPNDALSSIDILPYPGVNIENHDLSIPPSDGMTSEMEPASAIDPDLTPSPISCISKKYSLVASNFGEPFSSSSNAREAELLHEVDDVAGSSLGSAMQLSPVETPNSGGRIPSVDLPFAGGKGDVNSIAGSYPRIEHVLPSSSELSSLKDNGACLHVDGLIKTSSTDILKRGGEIDEAVEPGNGVVQGVDVLKFSSNSDGFSEDSQESKLKYLSPLARRVADGLTPFVVLLTSLRTRMRLSTALHLLRLSISFLGHRTHP
ncbi:hypothetical protein Nepgr_012439 [Nepenthes gracilis]|uniref:Uncharacterized protein n=1 Tax=Nepenthes gracilis TaxID=150966 RepID=A0AAD3SFZ9_NEPGR|nr:hypothetical protein Nepgr_012439 [Nepenthes gracilis]